MASRERSSRTNRKKRDQNVLRNWNYQTEKTIILTELIIKAKYYLMVGCWKLYRNDKADLRKN